MKPIERVVYLGLIVFFIIAYFFKGCNKQKPIIPKVSKVSIDSNAIFAAKLKRQAIEKVLLNDSIQKINKRLTAAKSKYRYLPGDVIVDTLREDSDCCFQIDFANSIIEIQDSGIIYRDKMISELNVEVLNLKDQVNFNIRFAEEASKTEDELIQRRFKHLLWRLYWLKK